MSHLLLISKSRKEFRNPLISEILNYEIFSSYSDILDKISEIETDDFIKNYLITTLLYDLYDTIINESLQLLISIDDNFDISIKMSIDYIIKNFNEKARQQTLSNYNLKFDKTDALNIHYLVIKSFNKRNSLNKLWLKKSVLITYDICNEIDTTRLFFKYLSIYIDNIIVCAKKTAMKWNGKLSKITDKYNCHQSLKKQIDTNEFKQKITTNDGLLTAIDNLLEMPLDEEIKNILYIKKANFKNVLMKITIGTANKDDEIKINDIRLYVLQLINGINL